MAAPVFARRGGPGTGTAWVQAEGGVDTQAPLWVVATRAVSQRALQEVPRNGAGAPASSTAGPGRHRPLSPSRQRWHTVVATAQPAVAGLLAHTPGGVPRELGVHGRLAATAGNKRVSGRRRKHWSSPVLSTLCTPRGLRPPCGSSLRTEGPRGPPTSHPPGGCLWPGDPCPDALMPDAANNCPQPLPAEISPQPGAAHLGGGGIGNRSPLTGWAAQWPEESPGSRCPDPGPSPRGPVPGAVLGWSPVPSSQQGGVGTLRFGRPPPPPPAARPPTFAPRAASSSVPGWACAPWCRSTWAPPLQGSAGPPPQSSGPPAGSGMWSG